MERKIGLKRNIFLRSFLTSSKGRVNSCSEMTNSFEKNLNHAYGVFSNGEEILSTSQRQVHFLSSLGIYFYTI